MPNSMGRYVYIRNSHIGYVFILSLIQHIFNRLTHALNCLNYVINQDSRCLADSFECVQVWNSNITVVTVRISKCRLNFTSGVPNAPFFTSFDPRDDDDGYHWREKQISRAKFSCQNQHFTSFHTISSCQWLAGCASQLPMSPSPNTVGQNILSIGSVQAVSMTTIQLAGRFQNTANGHAAGRTRRMLW